MAALTLLVRNARVAGWDTAVDIGCRGDKIAAVAPGLDARAERIIDAAHQWVSPPFVDSHFHLDATLCCLDGQWVNTSGTLLEGIALWRRIKPTLTVEGVYRRAERLCHWAIAQGNLAIRSHVDICDPRLVGVEALLALRRAMAPHLEIQLVAFPQDGYLRDPTAAALLERALDLGVDGVGGIPHFERTMADGAASIERLCRLAAERGLWVDMHCDESDDPHSRHVETLAQQTLRFGLQGRVAGSHLTSMHSMDNYYVAKLLPLLAEADLQVIANPLINLTLQGRFDSYPRRRGLTRIPELQAAGINVSLGHDCVADPWYSLGTHDMLDVAHMAFHGVPMTSRAAMTALFDAVTHGGARALGLTGYGIAPGCWADFVVLVAQDPVEALRLRPARRFVVRRGRIIAQTVPQLPELCLADGPTRAINFGTVPGSW